MSALALLRLANLWIPPALDLQLLKAGGPFKM